MIIRQWLMTFAVALSLNSIANALIVGNQPGVVPATTGNPAEYPGWTHGDPGWYNVAVGGNYVYLGDGWVLSARHVGYNVTSGVRFQTMLPDGSLGPVETFHRIPGSYYHDYGYTVGNSRQYAVSNPTTIQSETGEMISLEASNGTYFTDLQLFRINGDPGLPPLKLPSQPLPQNFARANAPEVVVIGTGRSRQATERSWYVTIDPDDDTKWTWSTSPPASYDEIKRGYSRDDVAVKRFGTNRLADPRPNGPGNPNDPGAIDYSDIFKGVVSDTTAVLDLRTGDGVTRSVISMMTIFDAAGEPGTTVLEFQAQGGNSGSSVFYKRDNEWELVGILNAILMYPGQPGGTGVYGNATLMSDLYFYNQDYHNSIRHIIDAHPDYSHIGDVNLDGVVTEEDVAAWRLGWGYDNGLGYGTLTSWKMGDLNRDGRVDAADYVLLRAALDRQNSGAANLAGFGIAPAGSAVPEPSAGVLAVFAAGLLAFAARGRRRCVCR